MILQGSSSVPTIAGSEPQGALRPHQLILHMIMQIDLDIYLFKCSVKCQLLSIKIF